MQEEDKPLKIPGTSASSPWRLPPRAWLQVIKRVWIMTGFHNLTLLAGGVAFFSFLAITPLILATVMIYGLIGDVAMVERQVDALAEVVPPEVANLLKDQLIGVVTTSARVKGLAVAVALFFAIYGAMRAASGLISALNVINEEIETRGIVQLTLRAVWLTLAAIGIAIVSLLCASIFAWLQVTSSAFLGPVAAPAVQLLTWSTALLLASFGFAVIMRFGPDRAQAKWRWLTPGAVVATILFVAISFGFSLYVAYIADYNATYGSLSAMVVFLMWLFLSAYCVLLGALINAEAERQTFRDSTIGPEKPIGSRGAVMADTTVLDGYSQELKEKRRRIEAARLARRIAREEASS